MCEFCAPHREVNSRVMQPSPVDRRARPRNVQLSVTEHRFVHVNPPSC